MRVRYHVIRDRRVGRWRDRRTGRFVSEAFAHRSRASQRAAAVRAIGRGAERPHVWRTTDAPWGGGWRIDTARGFWGWDRAWRIVRERLRELRLGDRALVSVRGRIREEWVTLSRTVDPESAIANTFDARSRLAERPSSRLLAWSALRRGRWNYLEEQIREIEIVYIRRRRH